ncbi:MAG: hypothetical protein CO187_08885 [Zetaproteobacteria bacterium CG_4_9_14_3_um_filter_53_7]|nr:MAG: hypothetical protein CO187_08885 [Zetaproteobacteria bacterium CG_4_9_14_3_um_filter_53_7]
MRYAAMIGILTLSLLAALQVANAGTVASESTAKAEVLSPSSSAPLLPVTATPIMTYQRTFTI